MLIKCMRVAQRLFAEKSEQARDAQRLRRQLPAARRDALVAPKRLDSSLAAETSPDSVHALTTKGYKAAHKGKPDAGFTNAKRCRNGIRTF
eukprot:6205827-Pleurochrysis_carterae.AAC.2